MLGEAGGDLLLADDGLADEVDCGPDADLAELDLADTGGVSRVRVDEHRRAHIALGCPRRAHRRARILATERDNDGRTKVMLAPVTIER
jgi:hypothetical protein